MSTFEVNNIVRVILSPDDVRYTNFNNRIGYVSARWGTPAVYRVDFGNRATLVVSEAQLVYASTPGIPLPTTAPSVEAQKGYRYVLELDQLEYVEMMQLVLQFGLSNNGGYKLSEHTVKAISDPDIHFV